MATQTQIDEFIGKIAPIAQRQAAKHNNKIFVSVCIAQACCESGYGTSGKMINANAVFGIKVGCSKYHFGTAWKDKAYSTVTKECYDGKTYQNITDMFRAYDSLEDSVEDYFDLLTVASRYKYALNQSSPLACIQGIQKAPYATAPDYVTTIMSIIKNRNLTKYDVAPVQQPIEMPQVAGQGREYYPAYKGTSPSIVNALAAVGEKDTSYKHRQKIAAANGFANYCGKTMENLEMVRMLKDGKLKRA